MNTRLGLAAALVLSPLLAIGCSDLGSPLAPAAQVTPSALDFGTIALGTNSERTVTISNVSDASLSGEVKEECLPYSIVNGGGPFTLAPGGSHDVRVRFTPESLGLFTCTLSLGDAFPPVGLSGEAAFQLPGAECVVRPAALDFGSRPIPSNTTLEIMISNPGTEPTRLNVGTDDFDFNPVVGSGAHTLAPGDSHRVVVSFRPSSSGPDTARITTGPGCPDVRCVGIGTVSFSANILPIFNARGCNSGCHTRFFNSAASIVNVTTVGYVPAKYIVPFDLSRSVIYGKVTNSGQYGQSMPQGSPLIPLAERNLIRDWILQGALDN